MLLIDKVRMRTSRIGRATQARWGIVFADRTMSDFQSRPVTAGSTVGHTLFGLLPPDMFDHVTNTTFDPYNQSMTKAEVRTWLWDHAVFGPDGHIVAIHDRGDALVYAEGWEDTAEWFIRVKNAEWRKVERNG